MMAVVVQRIGAPSSRVVVGVREVVGSGVDDAELGTAVEVLRMKVLFEESGIVNAVVPAMRAEMAVSRFVSFIADGASVL